MTRSFAPRTWKTRTADRIAQAPRPIPANVLDAVLRYSDIQEDMGCGRTLMRLSATRLADDEVRRALGDAADRAGRVSILWNEDEGQIIRVLDGALAQSRMAA